jgi:hypothetical protein
MQKKQSTIRNAKTIGMLLMNLAKQVSVRTDTESSSSVSYKLRNHGRDATESCTSTSVKWSCIMGKQRVTSDSKTRWSSSVPCMDVLLDINNDHERVEGASTDLKYPGSRRSQITSSSQNACSSDM